MKFRLKPMVCLLCVCAGLGACSKPAAPEEPVRAVKVMTVGVGQQTAPVEFSGEVRARVESRLGFRVGGKLIRRSVELGQHVQAGQVLAQLDAQDFQLSVDAARAQLAAATSNRDLAAADFRRYKELREQNFISNAELERRESAMQAAQAQWQQAQSQLSGQNNLARYTTLVSEVAGVVTAVEAEVAQVLGAGTPVLRIAQDGPRDVVLAVPENRVLDIPLGSAASVQVWASSASIAARVREVAASADPLTRTYSVKLGLEARDALPLGATVSVRLAALEHAGESVIKLPTSALVQAGNANAVWRLDPGSMTVHLQPIAIASADGNEAVVNKGLQAGMQVVVAGVHVLAPGQKVMLYQTREAAAAVAAGSGVQQR